MSVGVLGVAAGVAALTCAGLSAASWRALVRTGNGMLMWFTLGFAVMGLKSAVKSYRAFLDVPDSFGVEIAFSIVDVLAVGFIAWPVIAGRTKP